MPSAAPEPSSIVIPLSRLAVTSTVKGDDLVPSAVPEPASITFPLDRFLETSTIVKGEGDSVPSAAPEPSSTTLALHRLPATAEKADFVLPQVAPVIAPLTTTALLPMIIRDGSPESRRSRSRRSSRHRRSDEARPPQAVVIEQPLYPAMPPIAAVPNFRPDVLPGVIPGSVMPGVLPRPPIIMRPKSPRSESWGSRSRSPDRIVTQPRRQWPPVIPDVRPSVAEGPLVIATPGTPVFGSRSRSHSRSPRRPPAPVIPQTQRPLPSQQRYRSPRRSYSSERHRRHRYSSYSPDRPPPPPPRWYKPSVVHEPLPYPLSLRPPELEEPTTPERPAAAPPTRPSVTPELRYPPIEDPREQIDALNRAVDRLQMTVVAAEEAEDRREGEYRQHEEDRMRLFLDHEERRNEEARQRNEAIWRELESRLAALPPAPASAPIPEEPTSEAVEMESDKSAAQQAASGHASDVMDHRIKALEDELGRLRADFDKEGQQRLRTQLASLFLILIIVWFNVRTLT